MAFFGFKLDLLVKVQLEWCKFLSSWRENEQRSLVKLLYYSTNEKLLSPCTNLFKFVISVGIHTEDSSLSYSCSLSYFLAKLLSFCSALKHAYSHSLVFLLSYPHFFPPHEKNSRCTKSFSCSSVFFSQPTSLISFQLFSHLERNSHNSRICPPKKPKDAKEQNTLKSSENAFVVWYRIYEPDLKHWKPPESH